MGRTQLNWIANFIWDIADDVLRDACVRGKYRDLILPMVVIRRLDAGRVQLAVRCGGKELDGIKLAVAERRLIAREMSWRDKDAPTVMKKVHKKGTAPGSLLGVYETAINGKTGVVEYKPDIDLRYTEQVPLLEKGGVEGFIRREVLLEDIIR